MVFELQPRPSKGLPAIPRWFRRLSLELQGRAPSLPLFCGHDFGMGPLTIGCQPIDRIWIRTHDHPKMNRDSYHYATAAPPELY